MEKVKEFYVEDSVKNPQHKVLVAVTESGQKYVVAGNHWNPETLEPYEMCWQMQPDKPLM